MKYNNFALTALSDFVSEQLAGAPMAGGLAGRIRAAARGVSCARTVGDGRAAPREACGFIRFVEGVA